MEELFCDKHQREKLCMAGESAHISNWYCPECDSGSENVKIPELVFPAGTVVNFGGIPCRLLNDSPFESAHYSAKLQEPVKGG